MGNCFVLQDKVIKVIKPDGKIIEYKSPIKIHEVLSEFPGHVISDRLCIVRHLRPDVDMLAGHVYNLLPLPVLPAKNEKKVLKFPNSEIEAGQENGILRIKLVISKQELEMMLRKGGVSVDEMVSQLQQKHSTNGSCKLDDDRKEYKGWKPRLESIPEAN